MPIYRKECASYPISIFIAGSAWEAETICRDYCDAVGFCVTVTGTTYCYTEGQEPGVIVGLINHPRFPSDPKRLLIHAETLAERLRTGLGQDSYTIQAPDQTFWFSSRKE